MSARNRELFGLIPATLLVTGGFTAVLLPRVSTVHRRAHRGAAHARLERARRDADLRRGVPRLLPVRALLHPLAAAERGPVHVPDRGCAVFGRPGRAVPDPGEVRDQAGPLVPPRAHLLLPDDRLPARLPRARALPLHDRRRVDLPAALAARRRPGDERRLPRDPRRLVLVPARGVREDRRDHLP